MLIIEYFQYWFQEFYKFMLDQVILNRYKLKEKLNIGAFYDVYRAININNEIEVAIQLQKKSVSQSKLFNEAKILKELQGQDLTSDLGFPVAIQTGTEGTFNYLVMDLFGKSLEKIMADNGGKIQLKFALQLGEQMLQRIKMVHEKGYIHRDLRPEHFLYGRIKRPKKLFITGFSMAKKYLRSDNKHLDYRDNRLSFTGVARYLSLNAHMGIEQSRRDDIEAFIYIMIYLIRGNLPWQKQMAKGRRQKYQKIFEVKLATPIETVCEKVPDFFKQLLLYARMMQYQDTPDYEYLKKTLKSSFISQQMIVFQT